LKRLYGHVEEGCTNVFMSMSGQRGAFSAIFLSWPSP
jgi:hypothetical protein